MTSALLLTLTLSATCEYYIHSFFPFFHFFRSCCGQIRWAVLLAVVARRHESRTTDRVSSRLRAQYPSSC